MSKFQAQEEEIGKLKERVQVLEDREGVASKQSGEDAPINGRSNNEGEVAAERISNDSEEIAKAQKEEIGRLKERVQVLEDRECVATKQSGDDAPIKGMSNNEGEAAAERISNNPEEIARVLTSMDAATVLAGEIDEVMVESNTPKKKKLQEQIDAQVARELEEQQEKEDMRMNEQIARDAEVARIHAEEEIQGMIDSLDKSNETIAKYLQEYQEFASELPLEKRIELISDLVKYQEHYTKGEGSGTPTEPHHTPSPKSSSLPTVADEPASPVRDDSQGEACPTDSGFIADQDRATIAKSFPFPHDSAPRVTSHAAEEGSMQQNFKLRRWRSSD
nr:hypothetical protein [Tanacetum cinerariifolium]